MSLSAAAPTTILVLRAARTLVTALAACVFTLGYTAAPTLADECPNAALRAQNNSTRLPDCRAYEMVSPPFKEGFAITPQTFSDGGAVSFTSVGQFAGNALGVLFNEYVSTRSSAGWATVSPGPSAVTFLTFINPMVEGLSADLGSTLWLSRRRVAPVDAELQYYLRGPDGSMTRVGPGAVPGMDQVPFTHGASADLSHILFSHGGNYGTGSAANAALYEHVGTGNNGPARPVSVDNNGQQVTAEACPAGTATSGSGRTMSVDGRVIVFGSGCGSGGTAQLWVRVGGSATVAVSGSECTRSPADPNGPCNGVAPPDYEGMADDGSRVFFTATQQLVNSDTDTSSDLYACEIPAGAPAPVGAANPCSSLIRISGIASSARVQNVAAVSDDGAHVYFTAQGVLADNLGINDAAPVDGESNLYLWTKDAAHPAGQVTFVTSLPDGGIAAPGAQTTADGRYLVFGTSSRLVIAGPGVDTDSAVDVYRYDADRRTMVRVSTAVSGSGGNSPDLGATLNKGAVKNDVSVQRSNRRSVTAMTSDGSTVVFETGEALSADDINGGIDVYVWHDDGRVSLISDGVSRVRVASNSDRVGGGGNPWITPSGHDIFFTTNARLTGLDGDVNADIYDARVGGGFDLTQRAACSGDGCQGQRSALPNLAGPSSAAAGDLSAGDAAAGFSLRAVTAAQRKRLATTGRVKLTVTANTAGTVSAAATMILAGKPARVGSARQTMTRAGRATLALTLSKKARARLAARGRLTVKVVVSHSKVPRGRSVTLRLSRGGRS
jgi:hypothetical protein